jgi:hypothetical protein
MIIVSHFGFFGEGKFNMLTPSDTAGVSFDPCEHVVALGWRSRWGRLGVSLAIMADHDEAEEIIEVSMPCLTDPRFMIWRDSEGRTVVDDIAPQTASFRCVFPCLPTALRHVAAIIFPAIHAGG